MLFMRNFFRPGETVHFPVAFDQEIPGAAGRAELRNLFSGGFQFPDQGFRIAVISSPEMNNKDHSGEWDNAAVQQENNE